MTAPILRMTALVAMFCLTGGNATAMLEYNQSETSISAADTAEAQVAGVPSRLWPFFKEYQKLPHFRALVCAGGGRAEPVACGASALANNPRDAIEGAMANCKRLKQKNFEISARCTLRFVGNIDVTGFNRDRLQRAMQLYQQNRNATNKDLGK